MRDRHLRKLEKLGLAAASAPFPINLSAADKARVKSLLDSLGVSPSDKIIAISAGAKSHTKRWPAKGFIGLCGRIWGELGAKILLIGDKNDAAINKEIFSAGIKGAHDVTGRTGLRELLHLLSLCRLLVTNDSAPLHAASAVGLPTVAIFGPTSHKKYGPLAPRSVVVHRAMACSPCEQPQCRFGTLACITDIQEAAVWDAVKKVFYGI
jgi:lipopolysaccharide heptosyltransferase II